jgi:muramoyltetrapeptide carboxypeptidase
MAWKALQEGDTVAIIAPAYGGEMETIEKAKAYITSLGLIPRVTEDIIKTDLFCSNTEAFRFADIERALMDDSVKAIWCVKGGYGCAHVMPPLLVMEKPETEKPILGFSDITLLHLFAGQHLNWVSLHAPTLNTILTGRVDARSKEETEGILFGRIKEQLLEDLTPMNAKASAEGVVEGSVVGGNLCLLTTSLGTPWQVNTKGKILLLEDTEEKPYRLDRMLVHLRQAGVFDEAAALILGDFDERDDEVDILNTLLARFVDTLGIPVFRTPMVGHGKQNRPVPLNSAAQLTLGKSGSLRLKTGAA